MFAYRVTCLPLHDPFYAPLNSWLSNYGNRPSNYENRKVDLFSPFRVTKSSCFPDRMYSNGVHLVHFVFHQTRIYDWPLAARSKGGSHRAVRVEAVDPERQCQASATAKTYPAAVAGTRISGSFIQLVDVEVAYRRGPVPPSRSGHLRLESPLRRGGNRETARETWLITRHGPLLLFITVMSRPCLLHFGLAGDQLATGHDREKGGEGGRGRGGSR